MGECECDEYLSAYVCVGVCVCVQTVIHANCFVYKLC